MKNSLRNVRDALLGQDACRLWTADSPTVQVDLKNAACQLLSSHKMATIAVAAGHSMLEPAGVFAPLFRSK